MAIIVGLPLGKANVIFLLTCIGGAVSGLFLVAAGQVTRATVENADHAREILKLIKNKA